MIEAADSIAGFIREVSQQQFSESDLIRSAVLQKLIIIGEAAANISPTTRELAANLPWSHIVAFRNLAVHRYFRVDWEVVWTTATGDVPTLGEQIPDIIAKLGAGDQK